MKNQVLGAASLIACLALPSFALSAPALSSQDQCASCAMWITKYPGPKGAVELTDGTVQKFCSARGAACGWAKAQAEGKAGVLWMHDAGVEDWKSPRNETMFDAREAWFVYGSSQKAVMGPSLAPFADEAKARDFQKRYGGKIYRLKDLTAETLGCGAKY